jgi:4-aminobutyrate aminotransferase-like enzyme
MNSMDARGLRTRVFGPGMSLSYERPIHPVSASGVWITEADGTRLLDAYNNVPHVGHARPEVVDAIASQAALLNTNTRYLVDGVLEYADRLVGLLPDSLDVVYFANSGSEANDLAWRMARTVTDRSGAIVTANAYHGSTELTMATSPEGLAETGAPLPPWVATLPMPDALAQPSIEAALSNLRENGAEPAFLAVDTVFSSDGVLDPGTSLSPLADQIRDTGGLFVADEVQAGFGRVGTDMWGFAKSGVVPDIVTFGKPMGNGHPLAAVVTTREIAEQFTERGYFFSTFAGNPVSAAAGMAVLDVMEAENLAQRADRVGEYMRTAIREIDHQAIAEVRGRGQFTGVEITDDGNGPDAAGAHRIVNAMRENNVLIGATGPHENVLKIRPPLVFSDEHADQVVDTLVAALKAR